MPRTACTSFDLQRRHEWRHRETRSITGATALVVGTGGIGREIAKLLRAAGLVVRGAGRRAATDDPDFGEVVASDDLAVGGRLVRPPRSSPRR